MKDKNKVFIPQSLARIFLAIQASEGKVWHKGGYLEASNRPEVLGEYPVQICFETDIEEEVEERLNARLEKESENIEPFAYLVTNPWGRKTLFRKVSKDDAAYFKRNNWEIKPLFEYDQPFTF